jgi:CheY-like chemotaxis protein
MMTREQHGGDMNVSRRALFGGMAVLAQTGASVAESATINRDAKPSLPDDQNFHLDHVYLNAAYAHPLGDMTYRAMDDFLQRRRHAVDTAWPVDNARDEAVRLFAALINANPKDIAEPIVDHQLEPISELRILAVDDHEINRRAMKIMLEAFGLQASFAVDGPEALSRLRQEPFDVVLMDIHMPGIDGLEVCRQVRMASGPNRSTPIIAVTGAAEAENRARYLDAGITACIGKPIASAELYEAISETLSYPVAA